jgi:hypothetical protein
MITSTDGKYSVVNKAKTLAKKPGQHKRVTNLLLKHLHWI